MNGKQNFDISRLRSLKQIRDAAQRESKASYDKLLLLTGERGKLESALVRLQNHDHPSSRSANVMQEIADLQERLATLAREIVEVNTICTMNTERRNATSRVYDNCEKFLEGVH